MEINVELLKRFLPRPTLSMKDAMLAFASGKDIEYRVCVPGLPESENPWQLVNRKTPQFDEDWDYRIFICREDLINECKALKVLDVNYIANNISDDNVIRKLVNAVKTVDEVARQVYYETR